MPRNGNIALAVRENIALYMSARPKLRLRDIATTCDLSYSGLSKLMAAKSTVTALSTDTIDKLASGLNIPAAWLVISSGTEMANMRFTGAKVIDEFLINWAKNLFVGDAGYDQMRQHYTDDYYATGFNPESMRDAGFNLITIASFKKNGYEIFGISAEDEYKINHTFKVTRFVINSAKIISHKKLVVTYESLQIEGHTRESQTGATCLSFESTFQEMIKNVPSAPIRIRSNSVVSGKTGHKMIVSSIVKDFVKQREMKANYSMNE